MNFLQQLINGLVLGHAYALLAVGWTVLLGVARLVNFGHGQIYMLCAFTTWFIVSRLDIPYPLAIVAAVGVGAAVGAIMQKIMMGLTLKQDLVRIMIVTLGFGYVLEGAAALFFGSSAQILETPLTAHDFYINDLWFNGQDFAIIIVAMVFFVALKLIVENTQLGRLVRMVAEDPPLAQLAGINVKRVYIGVFAFEGAAVALAAALVAPRTPILTSMGFEEVIITFVVVVLGGIGSIAGSYVAGLLLGLFAAMFGWLADPSYTMTAAFCVLIAILAIRPGGFAAKRGGN